MYMYGGRSTKNKYELESSYKDAHFGIFIEGIGSQTKKVMTTCIIYDVIVISVYYANFKNCCKSQFLTDFDNSGWK